MKAKSLIAASIYYYFRNNNNHSNNYNIRHGKSELYPVIKFSRSRFLKFLPCYHRWLYIYIDIYGEERETANPLIIFSNLYILRMVSIIYPRVRCKYIQTRIYIYLRTHTCTYSYIPSPVYYIPFVLFRGGMENAKTEGRPGRTSLLETLRSSQCASDIWELVCFKFCIWWDLIIVTWGMRVWRKNWE